MRDLSGLQIPIPPDPGATPAPAEARNYDVDSMSPVDTYGVYYGYSGPWYSQLKWDRGITVLTKSVGRQVGTAWGVFLLARNDTLAEVGRVTVTATLLDDEGHRIRTVTATSAVPDARPGEPVPVAVSAPIPAARVDSVRYTATASAPQPVERRFSIDQLQTASYGDRQPLATTWWTDTGAAPYPYVSLLNVTNKSDHRWTDDHLVVAWFDKSGQVVMLSTAAVADTKGRTTQQLAYGQDFVVTCTNRTSAQRMDESQPMYWAWATPDADTRGS